MAKQAAKSATLLLVMLLVATSCSLISGESDDGGQPTGEDSSEPVVPVDFKVIASTIVDPAGNVFVPVGANIGAPVLDSDGLPVWAFRLEGHDITSDESVAAVEEWGWNTLRLNAVCAPTAANEFNADWGPTEMLDAIDAVVETYTTKQIVVMIECHDLTGANPELDSTDYAVVEQFWDLAADRYGDNTYVWFNHLNEFHAEQPEITPELNVAYWQSVIDDGYQAFVERGATNLVIFDVPNFGNDVSVLADPSIQDWTRSKCNVVWDWHSYGGLAPVNALDYDFSAPQEDFFEPEIVGHLDRIAAAEIPLLVGEIGYDWDSSRQESNFQFASEQLGAEIALRYAPQYGFGVLAWHANGSSGNAMVYGLKSSDSLVFSDPAPGESLSALGTLFWEYSQARKASSPVDGPTGASCQR